jgi:hypothetical protein
LFTYSPGDGRRTVVAAITRAIHRLMREARFPAIPCSSIPVGIGLRRTRTKTGSLLKAPIKQFESLNSVEKLEACLKHLVRTSSELLGVLYREFDPIKGRARLVRHFEFEG